MVNSREEIEYLSPLEISERDGVSKKTVCDRCHDGKYSGAIKTAPDRTNRQGLWLIPRESIYDPNGNFTPAPIPQQTDLALLKNDFQSMLADESTKNLEFIKTTIANTIEPLTKRINEQTTIIESQIEVIEQLKGNQSRLANGIAESRSVLIEKMDKNQETAQKITSELSRLNKPKESSGWLWFLLLIILILAVFIFMNWGKTTTKFL